MGSGVEFRRYYCYFKQRRFLSLLWLISFYVSVSFLKYFYETPNQIFFQNTKKGLITLVIVNLLSVAEVVQTLI